MKQKLYFFIIAVFALWINAALAAEKAVESGPYEVVKDVTDKMMALTKTSGARLKDEPEKYFNDVRTTLEPIVSFSFIAKNVMATYWKSASPEQRDKFTETFTQSMVETLGKGMASFTDLNVTTVPPEGDISAQKKVEIEQRVQGPDGTSKVSYTLAKNRSGEWKLINVVLNGVNLGKSFRDQFVQAMRQNDNNIDKVIENWAKQG